MAPAISDQNGSNQPALPRQDQTEQGSTPGAKCTKQVEQPTEHEVSIAIVNPSKPILTSSEMAVFEEWSRWALSQPLPGEDDFADEPLPQPYDPETATPYDWAKPAWIQEKDNDGNGLNSRI